MTNIPLRIHIVPIGNAPIDRLFPLLQKLRADRVYLITVSFEDAFHKTLNEMQLRLKNELKLNAQDIQVIRVDYYNLTAFLKEIAKICYIESENAKEIFLNVSGGTMISIVGTFAAMFFGVKPYFAKLNYNTNEIIPEPFFPPIPSYRMNLPTKKNIFLLIAMILFLKLNNTEILNKGVCIDLIQILNPETDITGKTSNDYNKINSRYLNDFLEQMWIENEPDSRGNIRLTDHGKFTGEVFAAFYNIQIETLEKSIIEYINQLKRTRKKVD